MQQTFQKNGQRYQSFIVPGADLVSWAVENRAKTRSIVDCMTRHRGHEFMMLDFVSESAALKNKMVFVFIFSREVLVGLARASWTRSTAYLSAIHVVPEFRGQGWCSLLVQRIIAAVSRAVSRFELDVAADNVAAIKCYEGEGFRSIRTNRNGDIRMVLISQK